MAILSKDALKQPAFVKMLEESQFVRSIHTVLCHDGENCFFPGANIVIIILLGPSEQPVTVRHHFEEKAVTFLSGESIFYVTTPKYVICCLSEY